MEKRPLYFFIMKTVNDIINSMTKALIFKIIYLTELAFPKHGRKHYILEYYINLFISSPKQNKSPY
jgi:hypothetical protein